MSHTLERGQRYLLTIRRDQDRTDKVLVMDYMGDEGSTYLFSARPTAGTQTMPKHWLRRAVPVSTETPIDLRQLR